MWVGISETIRLLSKLSFIKMINNNIKYYSTIENSKYLENKNLSNNKFNEWLAGLIDGDGCFLLSKKGYASLEIVMQ